MEMLKKYFGRIVSWTGWSRVGDLCSLSLIIVWLFQSVAGTWYYIFAQRELSEMGVVSGHFNLLALFNIVVCLAALPPVAKAFKRLVNNR